MLIPRCISASLELYECLLVRSERCGVPMSQVSQMLVVERKNQKLRPGSYASICSQTCWCACSPLPSCPALVGRQGKTTRWKCLVGGDLHKSLSHSGREFHTGPRPSHVGRKGRCICDHEAHSYCARESERVGGLLTRGGSRFAPLDWAPQVCP